MPDRRTRVLAAPHPNDVDRKRIERALEERVRYRYVGPTVVAASDGYIVRSPCCSRNVDATGGVIDIAYLEFERRSAVWWLRYRDHRHGRWVYHSLHRDLRSALAPVLSDPGRVFWP